MVSMMDTHLAAADLGGPARNDNNLAGSTHPRILLALQDPKGRRWMTLLLRAKGFRVVVLNEPLEVWSLIAEHAMPCLSGFDYIICGGFRPDLVASANPSPSGGRFFLLLGPRGFVPFSAEGAPPPAWAFERVNV